MAVNGKHNHNEAIYVQSPNVEYGRDHIVSRYEYTTVEVENKQDPTTGKIKHILNPKTRNITFQIQRQVPKTGVLLIGMGGNNGTTVVGGILANKLGINWRTKDGVSHPNWYGSLFMSSTIKLGATSTGEEIYAPLSDLIPTCNPTELVLGGWDISSMKLGDAMRRAKVFDVQLQDQLYDEMQKFVPMKSVYFPDFIAMNQKERANNILSGSVAEQLQVIRQNIRDFKTANNLDTTIVLWTATTERYAKIIEGVNDTAASLMNAINSNHLEISPSSIYAVASILEGCSYINGSPQNTFVPGLVDLASSKDVFIAGNDFKSGQTKFKSVLVDFLLSAGMKPVSIVSYNHLGNNDGYNLSSPEQFRSKEISKSNLVSDMVASNGILFAPGEEPDHTVVIKYVPFVGDSKRAMDEYTSRIFMNGLSTIVVHNTCEDSLLAAPLIIDMIILTEIAERLQIATDEAGRKFEKMNSTLSLLGYMCKAPIVAKGSPVTNSLFAQRDCIINILKACVGLPPENNMLLENKIKRW